MANNNTPAFKRRQEEQRQQQRIAAAQAAQARVQAHRERATASIIDQIRPLQEQHMRQWQELESRYTAGMDPVHLNAPGRRISDFTLLAGPRGYAELTHAIQERVRQERARPATTYNMPSNLARYSHLLTALDQQRLGYVAPVTEDYSLHPEESTRTERISPLQMYRARNLAVDGHEFHTLSYPGVALRNPYASRPDLLDPAIAYAFGDSSRSNKVKAAPEPVANFLAPPTLTAAEAEQWRQDSPWG